MKWKDIVIRFAVCVATISALFGACSKINRMINIEDDNPAEEFVEQVIEDQTGIEIDLTPDSKE